jgi:site-specific DNA-methyltransferase (adenine-specific)
MSFTIKQENCIEFIKELKNKGSSEIFDAIITDPPYNISKENNFKTIGRSGIDFGPWDYGFDQSTWIREVTPLVKKGGSIIIFNDYKNFGEITSVLEECGFEVKDLLRWIKNNPMPRNTTRRYVTDYEYAIWATNRVVNEYLINLIMCHIFGPNSNTLWLLAEKIRFTPHRNPNN